MRKHFLIKNKLIFKAQSIGMGYLIIMYCLVWLFVDKSFLGNLFLFSSTSHQTSWLKFPKSVFREFEAGGSFKCVITWAHSRDSNWML